MANRPCLGCGEPTPGTRCGACQRGHDARRWQAKAGRYNGPWRSYSKRAIESHRALHGDVCPGWDRPPHAISALDFVTDHDVGPLCRGCNAVKAATYDKQRASGRAPGGGAGS